MTTRQSQQSLYKRRADDDEPVPKFEACPRYDSHELTDAQVEELIAKAVKSAISSYAETMTDEVQKRLENRFYSSIGKSVMSKVYWVAGVLTVAATLWLVKSGYIKP